MHDEIRLSYIGLRDGEVRVLKSIFTLAPQLSENYVLVEPDQLHEVDVILVNADDPDAIQSWNQVSRVNKVATSLMVTTSMESASGDLILQRPIRVQKLISALEEIVNGMDRTSNPLGNFDTANALSVLIVDDSFPVRTYMEHKLNELVKIRMQISSASSGEEALEKINGRPYDLIFLDVMMEGIDGYKVCKMIKSKLKTYIVMLTSKKSPFDRVRGTMSGCDAYITKPPTDQRLIEEIGKCVARLPDLQSGRQVAAAQ